MVGLPPSEDGGIQRLLDEGYTIYRRGQFIVGLVPYLNSAGELSEGLIADTFNFDGNGQVRTAPINHQMFFVGEQPFGLDGNPLFQGSAPNSTLLFDGRVSSFYWSWKKKAPDGQLVDYPSLYDKFVAYMGEIAAPAVHKFPGRSVTPYSDSLNSAGETPFPMADMNSARANIGHLDDKISQECVAVIGAGGTGSYILDLLSKCSVKEIRIFDDDIYDVHNAFRVPGPTSREELGQPKVDILQQRYGEWHNGIRIYDPKLNAESAAFLEGVTFAFLAVDKVDARRDVARILHAQGIPFINVGLGLQASENGLAGLVETNLVTPETSHVALSEIADDRFKDLPDEYDSNIQTVELNALNAAIAVFAYKRHKGYYTSFGLVHQLLFTTQTMQVDRAYA